MSDKKLDSGLEKDIAAWINQKFSDAMSAKEDTTARWMEYMNAWNNSLYEDESAPDYKTKHVSNLIYSTIESMRPIMFDGNPDFEAVPLTLEAVPYTKTINNIFTYEWARTSMKQKLISNSIYTLCIGTSIIMLHHNIDDLNPEGEVEPIQVNPFNIFPDPMATSVEDAEYIMYASYVHMNVLKDRYPDRAKEITGGDITYTELTADRTEGATVDNQVLLIECWCRDYVSMEEVQGDGEGDYEKRQKYPLGRVMICAPELGLVFEDKENPYQSGRFPFFIFKDIDIPFSFWGEGEIKWLLSPQRAINELSSQVMDNAKNTANMQWILDKNSGIPKGALTNRPGLIVRKNPGTEVRRDSPPAMPMYVSEMISRQESTMETISGIHDISIGKTSGRIESGTAVIALQEAAQVRLRLKITLQEITLGHLGQEWLSRIKQFWKTNRLIPIEKSVSENQDEKGLVGNEIMSMPPYSDNQNFEMEEVEPENVLEQDYRIIVRGSSGFNLNRASMLETMINLIRTPAEDGMPVVPREAVLDYLPDVNKQVIMSYFDKINQERQMQQQQAMMNNESIQQLQATSQGLEQVNQNVQGIQGKIQQEEDAKAREEIKSQGYQQGVNETKAMQNSLNQSGELPPELLAQLQGLTDEEMAQVLAKNPELAQML